MTNHIEQLDNLNTRIKFMAEYDAKKAIKEIHAMAWKHEFKYLCDAAGIEAEMRRRQRMKVIAQIRQMCEDLTCSK